MERSHAALGTAIIRAPFLVFAAMILIASDVAAQTTSNTSIIALGASNTLRDEQPLRIHLRDRVVAETNILALSAIAELRHHQTASIDCDKVLLGPSPIKGQTQTWKRRDVEEVLALKGIDVSRILWEGAERCLVTTEVTSPAIPNTDRVQPGVTEPIMEQASRVVAGVIQAHLLTTSATNLNWIIEPRIPEKYGQLLSQRRSIVEVRSRADGGSDAQVFTLIMQPWTNVESIEIEAVIRLPELVVAAAGPLAKGRVINDGDLKLVRLTPSMRAEIDQCYLDQKELLGKELRKSISTGQPVLRTNIGPPRVVQNQDVVRIRVISGAIQAETTGRALQAGGVDEIVEVEVSESKKRLASRVVGPNLVEVIAR